MSDVDSLRAKLHPFDGDFAPLLERVGDRRFVLLGESTHGTHEFYAARAAITQRLIVEKGFDAVAVEADWPDAYRVNAFVRGDSSEDAERALGGFRRFPTWMWRNRDVLAFLRWLRRRNESQPTLARAGFYGLDLYSLYTSIGTVLRYLDRADPEAARRARYRYGCFEHFGEDPQRYGYAASFDLSKSCEDAVVGQLLELREMTARALRADGSGSADALFHIEQNARLVRNAEAYYRAMFRGRVSSWNLRDEHMTETVAQLAQYLERRNGHPAKIAVWAHNSHLGDARATAMGREGEINVGQRMRERYGDEVVLVGFTTFNGAVAAASEWDAPVEIKRVRDALPGSLERLFHETGVARFLVAPLRDSVAELSRTMLERAIGVVYLPETERQSHYFDACVRDQFDAILHVDTTSAVEPLDRVQPVARDIPESYPTGL
jgi:erythromycin esterase-like protein